MKTKLLIVFLVLLAAWLISPLAAQAQSETPYDLVNEVNVLRALNGLEPYQIDPQIMAYAQQHSEYQAATMTSTHRHSDGSLSLDVGLIENVAGGDYGFVTVAIVVYEIWVDYGHRKTMTGYATGSMGAGMAVSDDGTTIYYTLNVRPGAANPATVVPPAGTVPPLVSWQTSAPGEDGSIIHVVSYGETLWSIAITYGVTIDEIRRLNGLADDSTVIYVGQKLMIRPAYTLTPSPAGETSAVFTGTPPQAVEENPASTVIPSRGTTALPSTAGITLTPSPWLTSPPADPANTSKPAALSNMTIVIILLLIIAAVFVVLIFAFQKYRR